MPPITRNTLFYGDNLPILRDYVDDESVDLVYLDPPFNSNRSYNVLFRDERGREAEAQITAFEDTWHWNAATERVYQALVTDSPPPISGMIHALRQSIGANQMMAYLTMMAARLVELHRVLKPTGSLYLHCDPTASHYLKIILDAIFGPERFVNEISWKRSSAHSDTRQGMHRYGRIRDILLFYTKTPDYTWNPQYAPYDHEYLESEYRHVAADGRRYKETDLTAAKPGGDTEYDWHVRRPAGPGIRWEADLTEEFRNPRPGWEYKAVRPYQGRYWAFSKANLIEFARTNKLIHRETGMPRLMHFAMRCQAYHYKMSGLIFRQHQVPKTSATPPKNHSHSWSASWRPAATPATSCSTRSAAAAPPSRPRKSWAGAGSASTSPTSPSP